LFDLHFDQLGFNQVLLCFHVQNCCCYGLSLD
jgi:hypothetical protein